MRVGTGNTNGVLRWIAGAMTLGTVLAAGIFIGQRSRDAEAAPSAVEQLRQEVNQRFERELQIAEQARIELEKRLNAQLIGALEGVRIELREINRRLTRIEDRQ